MSDAQARIVVDTGAGSDARELADAARQLREMLRRRQVGRAEPLAAGAAPPGSKAGELLVAGTVVVTLAPPLINAVVAVVQAWSERAAGRSAQLVLGDDSLEMTGLTAHQQQELIDRFLYGNGESDGEGGGDGDGAA
ncbi:hypothetical protein AB0O01_21565 [Streptomyces sp. NPDC093252]|uniref:hypothetical protein n=1 Tax=Streptomyces sp. NPDC093252 TaxID=3154980 RepID=UPI00342F2235